jgi:hypothetical protein
MPASQPERQQPGEEEPKALFSSVSPSAIYHKISFVAHI